MSYDDYHYVHTILQGLAATKRLAVWRIGRDDQARWGHWVNILDETRTRVIGYTWGYFTQEDRYLAPTLCKKTCLAPIDRSKVAVTMPLMLGQSLPALPEFQKENGEPYELYVLKTLFYQEFMICIPTECVRDEYLWKNTDGVFEQNVATP